ncbi:MAG: recombinase family protein [Nanoarchaeota archaeon]|nr:recombinase family protein [Nanoarchaeota archaeon]
MEKENKNKAIILNRVSSKKQDYTLQEQDCLEFAKQKGFEVLKVFGEIASAGKSKQKLIYEAEALAIKESACIIVWKYDRAFRNKKDFADFMLRLYELHNIKVYSVQEEWVNMLWEMTENLNFDSIPYPFNEKIKEDFKSNWRLMIKIIGKMAEDEIKDLGKRVRNAVRKKEGHKTKSYKGNLWGRATKINQKLINEVLEKKKQGLSVREISQSVWFYDKNRNQKFISKSSVQKIITDNRIKLKETSS